MRNCMKQFADLLAAQDTCIYVHTYEENEFIKDVAAIVNGDTDLKMYSYNSYAEAAQEFNEGIAEEAADHENKIHIENNATIYVYSRFEGLYKINPKVPERYECRSPVKDVNNPNQLWKYIRNVMNNVPEENDNFSFIEESLAKATDVEQKTKKMPPVNIFILKDMHLFLDKDTIRALRDLKENYMDTVYSPIVITAPAIDIPTELEKLFTLFEYELMDKSDVHDLLAEPMKEVGYDEEYIDDVCTACIGLTEREVLRAIAHSNASQYGIDTKIIHDEKIQIVKKSGALEYLTPVQTLEDTGGYESLKTWIREMKISLTPEAHEFGLTQPKGAMLVGLPGNGKTMTADIIANYLNIPLLKLDLARIMGSFVGQSERAIANALRIVKACAPCTLLVDEAEKLFGGYASSSNTDSGTLSRVLAQLLNFLQEDNTGVITIMTSNNVFDLPPELMRSGRLDAQWYFGFPNADERREILTIYLKKNQLEVTNNIFNLIIRATKNYSGAEIKEVVKNLLIKSYFRQIQEGKKPERTIEVEDVKNAIASIVPIYQSSKEKIDMFTEMAKGRYRNASAETSAA